MDTSTPITVTARRWSGGWELILDEDNATSVRSLARATEQVRDYLDTINPEVDHTGVNIIIVPDIGPGRRADHPHPAADRRRGAGPG